MTLRAFTTTLAAALVLSALAAPAAADDRAVIEGQAAAGTGGRIAVNQAAGTGNAQANLFAIGQLGSPAVALVAGVDDAALAGVAGDTTSGGAQPTSRPREAFIADDAFRGSQGVVQVNQTAGVGNASTNAIVLQLPGGTP